MDPGPLPPPRALEYLSIELSLRAAGLAAAALCAWSAALSAFVMSRAVDPAGAISMGALAALAGVAAALGAMRNRGWSRELGQGRLPALPRSTVIVVRSRATPVGVAALSVLLGYGFFGLWLLAAWRIAGRFPDTAYPALAGLAAVLLAASCLTLLRVPALESAAVRLALRDREELCAGLGAALREAAAAGRAEPLVSTGTLVGMGMQLLALIALTLDPACARVTIAILGPRPLGLPWQLVFGALLVGLTAPLPIMMRELIKVMRYASLQHRPMPTGPLGIARYLLFHHDAPDAPRTRLVLVSGSVYFLVLLAAWIAYTAARGL